MEEYLPPSLRGPNTKITQISGGFSGAGVYKVEADGQSFVLKISGDDFRIQKLAADAGIAPRVVHVDEARRAVVSELVVDRSFPAFLGNPQTREAAITQFGRTIRRLHDLPIPAGAKSKDPKSLLREIWAETGPPFATPAFVGESVRRVLDADVPASGRPLVLSHNDVNPTNLIYDGKDILLLDWDAAGPNEPFYDLATVAVFFRFDESTCLRLLSAHDGAPVATLPARFSYDRQFVAVFCGAGFLRMAKIGGHAGGSGEGRPSLGDFYQRLRAGEVDLATPEGRWQFGLALVASQYSS